MIIRTVLKTCTSNYKIQKLCQKYFYTCGSLRERVPTVWNKSKSLYLNTQYISLYNNGSYIRNYSMKKVKEFSFDSYDIIGFDLDGTLLRYNLNEMIPLEYEVLKRYLVKEKKYAAELLECKFDADFLQKGLVLDIENGNVLKLSSTATILRATHGTKPLSSKEIVKYYGNERQWSVSTKFFENPLSTWNGPLSEKMRTLLDYFDMPALLVFAQIVDLLDCKAQLQNKPLPEVYNVWPDVLQGVMHMYTRENFSNGQSDYFNALRAQPARYLLRTSDSVKHWLEKLKCAGKSLFLLTGSNIDFANFTASYALGENWQELFDSVVCYAKKPGYFTAQRPYLQIKELNELPGSEIELNADLSLNTAYTQGNWLQLKTALAKKIGKSADNVRALYLGDNLIQDVYTPVQHGDLDAIAVAEELLVDKSYNNMNYEFHNTVTSSFWGSYFCTDNERTLWASIITNYSELGIPSVDTIAALDIHMKICSENTEGYFPKAPAAFKL